MKIHYLDTIISPNVTEKSTSLSEFNKIVFKVDKSANKKTIKKNIEKITVNMKGKVKLVKNKKSFKPGYKKAIITLKKGQSIDLATGI